MALPAHMQVYLRFEQQTEAVIIRRSGHNLPQLRHYLNTIFPDIAQFEISGISEITTNQKAAAEVISDTMISWTALVEAEKVLHEDGYYEIQGFYLQAPTPPRHETENNNNNNVVTQAAAVPSTTNDYYADPWQNFEYFHSYSKLGIHGEMVKDKARTGAYKQAVEWNAADFKDKVVLDLGTGTGILAIFAAKAGAKRVYAVEASDLASWTELVVQANKLGNVIQVLKGRIEELQIPEKVDIIISEWMGTFLIFESMLESLLSTRDLYLKPDGRMFPTTGNLYLAPLCIDDYYQDKVSFWADKEKMWGLEMAILLPYAKKCAFEKPIIDYGLEEKHQIADPMIIKSFNFETVPKNEPYEKTCVPFEFKVTTDANFHGFAAWFDVTFTGSDPSKAVVLSTQPANLDTHWHQLMLIFDNTLAVKKGHTITGTIRWQRNPDLLRHLIFDISYVVAELAEGFSKTFYLWGTE